MTRTAVALLTLGDPTRMTGGYLFHQRLAERAAANGARLDFVSVPALPLPWALAAGPMWRRSPLLREADAVVVDSIAAAAAAPWLSALGAPVLGMLHQLPGGMEGSRLVRAVAAPLDRATYRRARILMVASQWLMRELEAQGYAPGRLRLLVPGKNPGGASPSAPTDEGRRRQLREGRAMAALTVANWLPRKGILETLEAVAALPDNLVTLHLVGDTTVDPPYAARVRRRLAEGDLAGRTVVHGVVSPAEVAALYRAADAFVLPSFVEPYGTVWGEAMAYGLPVVGWSAGNLPYLAEDGVDALMVDPGDVPALSEAIGDLARDEGLRARIGNAAAARAAARPTWDETAARFYEIVEAAVKAHRARPGSVRRG